MNSILTKQGFKDFVGGCFFTVIFEKADGSIRKMNGRLGVQKHVNGRGKHRDNETVLVVWERLQQGGQYRSFDISRAMSVTCHGMTLDLTAMRVEKRGMAKAGSQQVMRKAA